MAKSPRAIQKAPALKLTKKELEILAAATSKVNAIGQQFQSARSELQMVGALISDRLGIDILAGHYQVTPDGALTKVSAAEAP